MSFRQFIEAVDATPMTYAQALQTLGFTKQPTADEAKKQYWKLARQAHPDRHGNSKEAENHFKQLKQAYDILKNPSKTPNPTSYRNNYSRSQEVPEWETDKRSAYHHINRQDFSDLNFLKFKVHEEAMKKGGVDGTYHAQAFDGTFLRHGTSVYANPHILGILGKAVAYWNSHSGSPHKSIAVIATNEQWGKNAKVIWIQGTDYSEQDLMVSFEDSFNNNPGNDRRFTDNLRQVIEKATGIDVYA